MFHLTSPHIQELLPIVLILKSQTVVQSAFQCLFSSVLLQKSIFLGFALKKKILSDNFAFEK